MEKYKVFEIDKCFDEYGADIILVGAKSEDDIIEHFDEIFPPYIDTVIKEDWMTEDDWDEISEFGKYKDGDVKITPYFEDTQRKKFNEKHNGKYLRIIEVAHTYTDKPYVPLYSFGYYE